MVPEAHTPARRTLLNATWSGRARGRISTNIFRTVVKISKSEFVSSEDLTQGDPAVAWLRRSSDILEKRVRAQLMDFPGNEPRKNQKQLPDGVAPEGLASFFNFQALHVAKLNKFELFSFRGNSGRRGLEVLNFLLLTAALLGAHTSRGSRDQCPTGA